MNFNKIIIAGIGTDVGKTVTSAIIATIFEGDYWKPIQTGDEKKTDSQCMMNLISKNNKIHPSSYSFKTPVSPHYAAKLEKREIDLEKITLPSTEKKYLIIESVGGILVPLNDKHLSIDLFSSWDAPWILVSKNYLGSINHTLLTVEVLNSRNINILGLIFNGEPNPSSEEAIKKYTKLPCLGRIFPEKNINRTIIKKYVKAWKKRFLKLLNSPTF